MSSKAAEVMRLSSDNNTDRKKSISIQNSSFTHYRNHENTSRLTDYELGLAQIIP